MRQCCPELNLEEGDFLTELVCEKELLQQNTEEQSSLELTLEGLNHTVSAIFHLYKETKEIQGTRLGMAITKSLTDAMGGNIRGDSTLGKGSRFCVEISFAVSAAEMCNAVWMRG